MIVVEALGTSSSSSFSSVAIFLILNIFPLFIYCVYMCECVCRPDDNLGELGLSSLLGSRNSTHVVRLGNKPFMH